MRQHPGCSDRHGHVVQLVQPDGCQEAHSLRRGVSRVAPSVDIVLLGGDWYPFLVGIIVLGGCYDIIPLAEITVLGGYYCFLDIIVPSWWVLLSYFLGE